MNKNKILKPTTPEFELELAEILAEICRHHLQERRKNYQIDYKPEQPSSKRTFDRFPHKRYI